MFKYSALDPRDVDRISGGVGEQPVISSIDIDRSATSASLERSGRIQGLGLRDLTSSRNRALVGVQRAKAPEVTAISGNNNAFNLFQKIY